AVLGFGSAGMLSRRPARGKRVLTPLPPNAAPVNNREKYRGDAPGGVRSADRALMAPHVEVAPFIVNNNPETMERSPRSVPTAAGWFPHVAWFGQTATDDAGPHAEEHRSARRRRCNSLRCAAMPSSLRHFFDMRAPQDEDEHHG